MSTVRFVHVDHLRLSTSPVGIADAPAWLRQLACDSVRNSVRNVIEVAVADNAEFLLIAGRVTDSPDDLEFVIDWLDQQFETLRRHGIQVVAVAASHREAELLGRICNVVIHDGDCLYVAPDINETWRLSTSADVGYTKSDLVVTLGGGKPGVGRTTYNAQSSVQPSEVRNRIVTDGYLSVSAGPVQAISQSETWQGGCVVVDADVVSREIRTEFRACDVLRFATEDLHLNSPVTIDSLILEIARASDGIGKSISQTVIIDWRLSAEVMLEMSDMSQICESSLLLRLRSDLQSGHRGAWPRRISFAQGARLQLQAVVREVDESYIDVVSGVSKTHRMNRHEERRQVVLGGNNVNGSLVVGLQLLGRVA